MKKLVSIILAASTMAFSASAFAASVGTLQTPAEGNGVRNNVTALGVTASATGLPCFRPNDKLIFDVTGLTKGNQLTLISYKVDAVTLENTNIQYINQYTVGDIVDGEASSKQTIEYTVRDIEDGIYNVVINGNGDGDTAQSFYYKVGDPKATSLEFTEGETAVSSVTGNNDDTTYSVAFVAKATTGSSSEVSFAETGVSTVGFDLVASNGNNSKTIRENLDATKFNSLTDMIESNGTIEIYYGVQINNVPNDVTITATPVVIDKVNE